ncbi:MAG: thioesterase family protein [Antricoccus sp.]
MSNLDQSGHFARASAVRRMDEQNYVGEIPEGWDIAGNTNGGYLLSILTRALLDASAKPDAISVTAHFLSPGKPGAVQIDARVLRSGRTFTTVTGGLSRDGKILVHATGTFGDLSSGASGVERVEALPPQLPPPDECIGISAQSSFAPPFMTNLDLRLHPEDAGFATGAPHGRGQVRGWMRLLDDEPIDTVGLILATDAFPPTAFNAALPVAWTPTVELTTHIRSRPVPGWLRCEFTTRFVTGGFLEEDGVVWDSSDRLVAQSRQLALLPRG